MRADSECGGVTVKKIRSCVGFVFVYKDMWARCTIGCFILPVDIVVKIVVTARTVWGRSFEQLFSVYYIFIYLGLEIHAAELLQVQMSSAVLQERWQQTHFVFLARETTLFSGNELSTLKLLLIINKKLTNYAWCSESWHISCRPMCVICKLLCCIHSLDWDISYL